MSNPPETSNKAAFVQQVWSTIRLNLLQRRRTPCGSIAEILVPILFVVGIIVLYSNLGDSKNHGYNFVNIDETLSLLKTQEELFSTLCQNPNYTGQSTGLSECSSASIPRLRCISSDDGMPTGGVCTNGSMSASDFVLASDNLFFRYENTLMPIPLLDDMIKIKWIVSVRNSMSVNFFTPSVTDFGWLYVSPKNANTESLVASLRKTKHFNSVFKGFFDSREAADAAIREPRENLKVWAVIHVDNVINDTSKPLLDVSIRLNVNSTPRTSRIMMPFYTGGVTEYGGMYLLSGFLSLQVSVYQYFLSDQLKLSEPPVPMVGPMGTIDTEVSRFLMMADGLPALIMVFGFMYTVSQSTKRVVLDKELRLKEALLIMGLRQSAMYCAWFFIGFVQNFSISLLSALLMKATFLGKSNFFVVFFLFFFFSMTTTTISGVIASLFSKARIATVLSALVFFLFSIPIFAIKSATPAVVSALCLLSPSAFAQGLILLFNHEKVSGFRLQNVTDPFDEPNMLFIFLLLILDFLIYLALMLYLDNVMPNDWGSPRHPLFCILQPLKRFFPVSKDSTSAEDGRCPTGAFEPMTESEFSRASLCICGLTKTFRRGRRTFAAVDHLHMNLLEGEISVLLGHNGAGKSTTINMMTGMLKPDGGDCHIYGQSIRDNIAAARQEIGFCPQHNILWPDLTCEEHLNYYASIKGLTGASLKSVVDEMLEAVALQDKRQNRSSELSGGQKRKLSVAIAFVGGGRLVFLDEPTAGMDVGARRHTWDLLRRMSKSRTILLCTHFMDEADLLGDRIAIMSRGRLQCAGSSVFLKSKLGLGYSITISLTSGADRPAIYALVKSCIPSAKLLSNNVGEITLQLPMEYVKKFPSLLNNLDVSKKDYGIECYTLSATTLEEIFLRIASEEMDSNAFDFKTTEVDTLGLGNSSFTEDNIVGESCNSAHNLEAKTKIDEGSSPKSLNIWGRTIIMRESSLMCAQFRASLLKRYHNAKRDSRTQIIQLVVPVVMVLFAMLLSLVDFYPTPSLQLSYTMFRQPVQVDVGNCAQTISTTHPLSRNAEVVVLDSVSSALELSDHLLTSFQTHRKDRYTSLVCSDSASNGPTSILYNMSVMHAAAVGLTGYYSSAVMKKLTPVAGTYSEDILITRNAPLPLTGKLSVEMDGIRSMVIGILIMIPFSLIPSVFVSWVVKERECKAYHLQAVSGMRFSIYWLANYVFDVASYFITMLLVIVVLLIFNQSDYVSAENFGATFLLFFAYGLSCIAMSYAISFLFKEHTTAQSTVLLASFIVGFLLVVTVSLLSMFDDTVSLSKSLGWTFRIIPSYCIGEGIMGLSTRKFPAESNESPKLPWDMNVVGYPILFMFLEVPLFLIITIILDHPALRMRVGALFQRGDVVSEDASDEDEDVAMERRRVEEGKRNGSTDLVQVLNLRKVYSNKKVAVQNLTFGVMPGEVFGFLGTNGAGKTTTISILCQEHVPTSGNAYICGMDVVHDSREALRHIGYCPQFDALLDLLTVKEHLYLYASIRGVVSLERKELVTCLMQLCELTEYRNSRAGELSGGNKRKLSVALALIGGPSVVFLDEPSAGMDPVARRGLWTAISGISDSCSVVLTTHHLEEVEALAHRVGIMVDGKLRCLGNKTHLKNKYGSGYEMTIRMGVNIPQSSLDDFVNNFFPNASLREKRMHRFTYALPPNTSLAEAFANLESHKETLGIADYSVSQTSIEQVFLRISGKLGGMEDEEKEEDMYTLSIL